jgi:hypothetical protein
VIPTDTTQTTESWVCRACSSPNAGWRLRCERCGVLVGGSSAFGAPLPPPPVTPPTRKTGTAKTILFVVGCVAIGAAALGGGLIGIAAVQHATERREAEERVNDYLDGESAGEKEFLAADSQFRATFPVVPQRRVSQTDVAGVDLEFTMYWSELGQDAFSVGTYEVPSETPFDLNLGVNSSAAAVSGRVEMATPTTWQDFEAMEAVISTPGGAVVQMLVVRAPQRLYILQVVNFSGPSDGYEAFKASFEITP